MNEARIRGIIRHEIKAALQRFNDELGNIMDDSESVEAKVALLSVKVALNKTLRAGEES